MSHPLRWLALVALEQAELPAFDQLEARYAELFPQTDELKLSAATQSLLTLSIGELTAAIALVPKPIPWPQLEGPAATAWYWPQAVEALQSHAAHLLITIVDDGTQPVEKALALTRLTAAAALTTPASGIFWGLGRLVHSPGAFVDQAVQMHERNLPLYLWVDFRIERLEDGTLRLYSTGLEPLGGQELESSGFSGTPQELLEYAYNIAHYLVTTKKSVNDGDTFGLTDDIQATVRRAPSMFDDRLEVLQLVLGAP